MRCALDLRPLRAGPSGDRSHLLGLLGEFPLLAPQDEFLLCTDGPLPATTPDLPPGANFRSCVLPSRPGWLWTPLVWPRLLRRERVQVAHGVYLVPPVAPCPTVVTIHDVSFMAHPEWFPRRAWRRMRWLIPLSARRATRVVTASAHAAAALTEHLRVPPEKIMVIPYGASPHLAPMDQDRARQVLADRFGLQPPYLLAVGLLQPRKNLPRLLEAFARVLPAHPGLRLALVGATGWGNEAFHERLDHLRLSDHVVFCGVVSEPELRALYSGAALLVYPSLYEGFGIPPLEAMQCGTPVAASATTAIPEVVGEAAILFDPLDVTDMTAAIVRVLDDPGLAAKLAAAGRQRAARFSWRATAAAYLSLFHDLSA